MSWINLDERTIAAALRGMVLIGLTSLLDRTHLPATPLLAAWLCAQAAIMVGLTIHAGRPATDKSEAWRIF